MEESTKNGRGSNWAENEKVVLITNVLKLEGVIYGKFKGSGAIGGPGVSKQDKVDAWQEVANSVNAVCFNERSVEQCKKQYDNVKQRAKSKLDEIRRPKTGGGPKPKSPTPSQHLLLDGLSNRPQLVGLGVTYDTDDPMTSEMVSIGESSNEGVNNPQTGIVIGATTTSSTSRSKGVNNPQTGIVIGATTASSTSRSIGCSTTISTTRPKGLKKKKMDIHELEKTNIELENDVYSKKLVFLD